MDKEGYPEIEELDMIKNWEIIGHKSALNLIEYIRQRWRYADCGYFKLTGKRVKKLYLGCAGWSGNESIIDALQNNLTNQSRTKYRYYLILD